MNTCSRCEAENRDSDRFCRNCGVSLTSVASLPQDPALTGGAESTGEYCSVYHNSMLLDGGSFGCVAFVQVLFAGSLFAGGLCLVVVGVMAWLTEAPALGFLAVAGVVLMAVAGYGLLRWFGPVLASRRYIKAGQPLAVVEGPGTWVERRAWYQTESTIPRIRKLTVDGRTFDMNMAATPYTQGALQRPDSRLRVWYVPTTGLLVSAAVLPPGDGDA